MCRLPTAHYGAYNTLKYWTQVIIMKVQVSAVPAYETDTTIFFITQMDTIEIEVTPDLPISVVNMHGLKYNYQTEQDDDIGTDSALVLLGSHTFKVNMKPDDTYDFGFWEGVPGIKIAEMPKRYVLRRD